MCKKEKAVRKLKYAHLFHREIIKKQHKGVQNTQSRKDNSNMNIHFHKWSEPFYKKKCDHIIFFLFSIDI